MHDHTDSSASAESTAEDDGRPRRRHEKGSRERKQVFQPSYLINRVLFGSQLTHTVPPGRRVRAARAEAGAAAAAAQQGKQTRESRRTAAGDDVAMGSRAHTTTTRSLNKVRRRQLPRSRRRPFLPPLGSPPPSCTCIRSRHVLDLAAPASVPPHPRFINSKNSDGRGAQDYYARRDRNKFDKRRIGALSGAISSHAATATGRLHRVHAVVPLPPVRN